VTCAVGFDGVPGGEFGDAPLHAFRLLIQRRTSASWAVTLRWGERAQLAGGQLSEQAS
jgi:hypothetical protein